ncbi:MAG: TatD family hydrolase, partial [Terriglobales bacterium]
MIDSHCHPDDAAFAGAGDRAAMLERAAATLEGLVAIASPEFTCPGLKVWTTVGVHPHEAAPEPDWAALETASEAATVIAIGEIGLDYHYDNAPRARQIEIFDRQMGLAAAHHLP